MGAPCAREMGEAAKPDVVPILKHGSVHTVGRHDPSCVLESTGMGDEPNATRANDDAINRAPGKKKRIVAPATDAVPCSTTQQYCAGHRRRIAEKEEHTVMVTRKRAVRVRVPKQPVTGKIDGGGTRESVGARQRSQP